MRFSLHALPTLVALLTLALVPDATLGNEQDPSTPGALAAVREDGTVVDMPLRHTDVSVEITAFVARTTVEQVFVNPSGGVDEHGREVEQTFVSVLAGDTLAYYEHEEVAGLPGELA